MTGWLRGSWRQFEHGAANKVAAVRSEARLLSARATCVQQALDLSEGLAAAQVLRDFRDLELKQVVGSIFAVLRECVTVMLASTGGGALIGGVAGAFAGGVGAVPGVALGATLGAQLGELILVLMGLKALTEYIVQDMPEISRSYWHGIQEAWLAARLTPLPQQPVHIDQPALRHAAETIARAHAAMLVLLLTGIVAYLAKGRGTTGDLAKSVRGSKLGPGFAKWLIKNEGRLRAEPRLRVRQTIKEPGKPSGGPTDGLPRQSNATRRGGSNPDKKFSTANKSEAHPPVRNYGNIPESITTSSGSVIKPTPGKTTTVLGRYNQDMDEIINGNLSYPKTTDFGAKPGGYNVLNVPDSMFAGRTPEQFWTDVNKPFLDSAIERGDPIYIATTPDATTLLNADGSPTGFGREMEYLATKGYSYDPSTGLMARP